MGDIYYGAVGWDTNGVLFTAGVSRKDPLTEGGPLGLCAGDMSSTCHRNNKRAHGKYSAMNSNRECFSGGFFGEEDDNFGRG